MRRDDSIFLIDNQRKTSNVFKMTKTRTAVLLVMVVCSCGLIFSITDAYPAPEPEPETEPGFNDTKLGNNSRLVITHVVKTIEFEVGVVDDDGIVNDNLTQSDDDSEFYETDIQLLNMDLLKAVVSQAEEENMEGTMQPMIQQTNEANMQQMQNYSLLQLNNQTNS